MAVAHLPAVHAWATAPAAWAALQNSLCAYTRVASLCAVAAAGPSLPVIDSGFRSQLKDARSALPTVSRRGSLLLLAVSVHCCNRFVCTQGMLTFGRHALQTYVMHVRLCNGCMWLMAARHPTSMVQHWEALLPAWFPGTESAHHTSTLLGRPLCFESAPLAAVLAVDGQLTAMLRHEASAAPSQPAQAPASDPLHEAVSWRR